MKKWKSRILFHGGSIPVPSYFQKGRIEIQGDRFRLSARGKAAQDDIDIHFPLNRIQTAEVREKKYYSSTAYMLNSGYVDSDDKPASLELEIRSFGRRGRARAIARLWAKHLSLQSEERRG